MTHPLPLDEVLGSSVTMTELRVDGSDLLWLESRPLDQGRMTVVRLRDGEVIELTPQITVRSRIWEYGGGAWDCADQVLVVHDLAASQVVLVEGEHVRPLTPSDPQVQFGGLRVHPERDLVLAVREDHRGDGEPVSSIVALSLDPRRPTTDPFGDVLVTGADFHAGPRLSEQGRLAWFQWNHPSMPWDETEVRVARLRHVDGRWAADQEEVVLAEADTSAQHPQWLRTDDGDEHLAFTHDGSGFWTPATWDGDAVRTLSHEPYDHDHPVWTLTPPSWLPAGGRLLCHRLVDGWPQLGWLAGDESFTHLPLDGLTEVDSVAVLQGKVHLLASFSDRPPALVRVEHDGTVTVLHQPGADSSVPVSIPRSLTVPGPTGPVQAWFHAPAAGSAEGPAPTIVKTHGGPTAFAAASASPSVTFWTSRGFAVVDVNYGGSTGFGRAYRNRLRGQWGVVDVADTVAVVEHLVDIGATDPARISITGGSAGGYTTLQSLVATRTYTAGVSRYGIGDLEMLATDTHKFESRYLDSLVGPYPEAREVYLERSPLHHVDRLATAMLLLQGSDDKVVPPNQAEAMAAAVRAKGLPVALVVFPGEGHGFRGLDARRQALLAELAFYVELWGLPCEEPGLPRLDLG